MPILRQIAAAWREVRSRLANLVLLQILIANLVFAAVVPLSSRGLSWLIARSGELAVSNNDIADFLSRPIGVFTVLFTLAVLFFSFFVQGAGMLRILATGESSGAALGKVIGMMPRLARLALRQLLGYALVVLPILAAGALAIPPLLADHDINYYLQERPAELWQAVGIAAALGLLATVGVLWLTVRWLHSLPVLVFEELGARAALRRSARGARRAHRRLAGVLIGWFLVLQLVALAGAFLYGGLSSLLLDWAGLSLSRLVPILAATLLAELLLAQVLAFAGISIAVALVWLAYREAREGMDSATGTSPAFRFGNGGVVLIALVAFLVGAIPTLMTYADLEVRGDAKITAHRGSSRRAPENSLAAITAAIEDGADFVEIDVQETADGHVVLLHDLDLMRVAAVQRKIWEIELEELQELDAGSWFGPEFAGERVPTLSEAIERAGEAVELNIELKFNGHEPNLVRRVVEIVRETGIASRCVVTSLSLRGLREVEAIAPELETGLIVGAAMGDITRIEVDFFSVNSALVDYVLVSTARDAGKYLHAWTVNEAGELMRLLTLGVENVITDVPAALVEARAEFAELSGAERLLLAFHHRVAN